jgi:hypothetical protein
VKKKETEEILFCKFDKRFSIFNVESKQLARMTERHPTNRHTVLEAPTGHATNNDQRQCNTLYTGTG